MIQILIIISLKILIRKLDEMVEKEDVKIQNGMVILTKRKFHFILLSNNKI